uniref:Uncharacterized protein n=1 Tax=Globisporangium ultimum (strain ATCC 200006 / CBS 805.95 / DAOM BR144) TaxID=431595 RepID=K3W9P6_GLOUD
MWSIEENRTHEEVQSLSNAFYTSHFPEGAYISSESPLWANVRVLRHMCQHGKFLRQGPFGCVQLPEDSNELLLRSLSSRYLHQCRSFYQPLKKLLARQFKYVGRAQIDVTIAHDPLSSRQVRVVEFVGGFDPSSQLLCGVFCSFQ